MKDQNTVSKNQSGDLLKLQGRSLKLIAFRQECTVFLPREPYGQGSLTGYHLYDHKESEMAEAI